MSGLSVISCVYSLLHIIMLALGFLFINWKIQQQILSSKEGGDIGLFITLVFNAFNNNVWYLLNLISWFIKMSVQTFKPIIVIYRRENLFIIRNIQQFIGHCLIRAYDMNQIPPPTPYLLVVVFKNKAFLKLGSDPYLLRIRIVLSILSLALRFKFEVNL